jgi:hypothetical protein
MDPPMLADGLLNRAETRILLHSGLSPEVRRLARESAKPLKGRPLAGPKYAFRLARLGLWADEMGLVRRGAFASLLASKPQTGTGLERTIDHRVYTFPPHPRFGQIGGFGEQSQLTASVTFGGVACESVEDARLYLARVRAVFPDGHWRVPIALEGLAWRLREGEGRSAATRLRRMIRQSGNPEVSKALDLRWRLHRKPLRFFLPKGGLEKEEREKLKGEIIALNWTRPRDKDHTHHLLQSVKEELKAPLQLVQVIAPAGGIWEVRTQTTLGIVRGAKPLPLEKEAVWIESWRSGNGSDHCLLLLAEPWPYERPISQTDRSGFTSARVILAPTRLLKKRPRSLKRLGLIDSSTTFLFDSEHRLRFVFSQDEPRILIKRAVEKLMNEKLAAEKSSDSSSDKSRDSKD